MKSLILCAEEAGGKEAEQLVIFLLFLQQLWRVQSLIRLIFLFGLKGRIGRIQSL